MSNKLSDYTLIGDSHAAALLSKRGSIDWCCIPDFDSASIFSAILDEKRGGFFSIQPTSSFRSTQKYIADTNVVETFFHTKTGNVRLIDSFSVREEDKKRGALFPDHEILRVVEGVSGTVLVKMEFLPRIFYGKKLPDFKNHKKLGIQFFWKENIFILQSTLDPNQLIVDKDDGKVSVEFQINPGEQLIFSLSYSCQNPAIIPELKTSAVGRLQDTIHFWKKWIANCKYSGMYVKQVKRSLLTLKLLTHAASGAIVAAPTTSLPEEIGGGRNWDYRYCWLRDASFTIRVLVDLGFEEEAHAYMNWILHATQLTRPRIQVVYSIYGHAKMKEKTLDWLSGYMNSQPVRIGNGAFDQFQLDVYGEVLDAFYTYATLIPEFDRSTKKFIIGLGKTICKLWNLPDSGIWEVRSSAIHHTHSKVMAWVGLDRIIKLAEKYNWKDVPLEKFRKTAACIHQEVEDFGYNNELNSYTRELNGKTLDASLLTLPLVGYCDAASLRMASTTRMIFTHLSKNGLIYRYDETQDGVGGAEASFGICNFWYIQNLAKSGNVEQAIESFETILQYASPTGLFSEEIDPENSRLLGNYPQGFTHIGLINAALSINKAVDLNTEAL